MLWPSCVIEQTTTSFSYIYFRVADPVGFYPDPYLTFEKATRIRTEQRGKTGSGFDPRKKRNQIWIRISPNLYMLKLTFYFFFRNIS